MNASPEAPRQGEIQASGGLLVVATPIGNLEDLSPRARRALAECRLILAEDTRRVRKLLSHIGVSTPVAAFHAHNEGRMESRAISLIQAGAQLALVSEAGTPLLADPGFRLVRRCRELGLPVHAVPGPSAVVAALSVAGLPPLPFTFLGFLPGGETARRHALASVASLPHTLVIFLSPHRLAAELAECAAMLGNRRPAALLAELTKVHERCLLAPLEELAKSLETAGPRGEYTLVVGPPQPAPAPVVTAAQAHATLEEALGRGLNLAAARREAARLLGISRRELYRLLLAPRSPDSAKPD